MFLRRTSRILRRSFTALPRRIGDELAGALGLSDLPEHLGVVASKRGHLADYQSNVAAFAKSTGRPPPAVAASMAATMNERVGGSVAVVASSTGAFLNFRLVDAWLIDAANGVAMNAPHAVYQTSDANSRARVLVDFSSPNLGKQLHVGHLRSSVIGDSLARILAASGADVHRVSHVGDCGLPVAIVMAEFLTEPALRMQLAALLTEALHAQPRSSPGHAQAGGDPCLPPDPHASSRQWLAARIPVESLPTPSELSLAYEAGKRRSARNALPPLGSEGVAEASGSDSASRAQEVLVTLQATLVSPPVLDSATLDGAARALQAPSVDDSTTTYLCWLLVGLASQAGYAPLLQALDVHVPERGESVYAGQLENVVGRLVAQASGGSDGGVKLHKGHVGLPVPL